MKSKHATKGDNMSSRRSIKREVKAILSASALAGLGVMAPAQAQDASDQVIGEVLVKGIRYSHEQAIQVKRNAIGVLMGVELVLNGATVNFVAFAHYNPAFRVEGQVFALFVIVMAAAEAAIALAIVLNFYNNHESVDVDTAEELKG